MGHHTFGGTAHYQPNQAERIAACVQQGATAKVGLHADVGVGVTHGEAKAGLHAAHLANLVVAQTRQQVAGLGLEPIGVRLQQHHALLARDFKHACDFCQVECQRFFAQHMFARLHGANGPLGMQAVGQGDVNGVQRGIS